MNHAEFREWLEHRIKFHRKRPKDDMSIVSDALNSAYSRTLNKFNELPDVAAELEQVKKERDKFLDVINLLRNRQGKSVTSMILFMTQLEKIINDQISQPFIVTADINPVRDAHNEGFTQGLQWVLFTLINFKKGII